MLLGDILSNLAFKSLFVLFERFSTLSLTAFLAIIGIWVFKEPIKFINNN